MTVMLALITMHFIADFVAQSDWMAINKSKSWKALLTHTAVYSSFFLFFGWQFALITFVLHTAVDAVTSRITSWLWFIDLYPRPDYTLDYYGAYPFYARVIENRRHWFFVVIGLDQLIHYWTLAATHAYLSGAFQ